MMEDINHRLTTLLNRLEVLDAQQTALSQEVKSLRKELVLLGRTASEQSLATDLTPEIVSAIPVALSSDQLVAERAKQELNSVGNLPPNANAESSNGEKTASGKAENKLKPTSNSLERFIGENLISRIGALAVVIGVAFGANYAIEHDLISATTRILLGYFAGGAILGCSFFFRKKYEAFSAVLLSAGSAIIYLVTLAAYSLYALMPQEAAFGIMVAMTAFTVASALRYNRQVIAHLGLVGAYAVPFLLSDGSGRVVVLLIYVAIINAGILYISVRKAWKTLLYMAFVFSYVIIFTGLVFEYSNLGFYGAMGFAALYFLTFWAATIAQNAQSSINMTSVGPALLLSNAVTFYVLTVLLLDDMTMWTHRYGVLTLAISVFHFVSGFVIRPRMSVIGIFLMLVGVVFLTIAVPVEFEGRTITVLWALQAAVLYWAARTTSIVSYLHLSATLMLLACCSLVSDWNLAINASNMVPLPEPFIRPLLNANFFASVVVVTCLGVMAAIRQRMGNAQRGDVSRRMPVHLADLLPIPLTIAVIFGMFYIEIDVYFNQRIARAIAAFALEDWQSSGNTVVESLLHFKAIWLLNYVLLATGIVIGIGTRRNWQSPASFVLTILAGMLSFVLLTYGISEINSLRSIYLDQRMLATVVANTSLITIRYASFALLTMMLVLARKMFLRSPHTPHQDSIVEIALHAFALWVASLELVHWLELSNLADSDRLGLSLLWGGYALALITYGIWKDRQLLRLAAFGLLAVTLIKIMFYDLSDLNTISRTIVFIALGVLMLLVSYLYNRFRHLIGSSANTE